MSESPPAAPAPAAASRAPRALNLTAVLAAAALVDLVLHRSFARLFLPNAALGAGMNRALLAFASFASHLAGCLALVVCVGGFANALGRGRVFPRGMRLSLSVIGVVFVAIAGTGVVLGPLSDRALMHARISEAFLGILVWLAVVRAPLAGRAKIGVALLVWPSALTMAAVFVQNRPAWQGRLDAGEIVRAADAIALLAAVLAPILVVGPAVGRKARALGVLAGALATGALAAVLVARTDLVESLVLYALHLELPPPGTISATLYLGAFALAVGGAVAACASGLAGDRRARLLAYSFTLVIAGGHQASSAGQLLLSLTGLIGLALALTGTTRVVPSSAAALAA